MDRIRNGWFSEINELWPGQCMSLEVEEVLHEEKSDFQEIMVLKTKSHGRALILDGIIQCTEFDEFAYQEMISFLPLCAHPSPADVLIVGGGDGGVAREVSKHPSVRTITQVEIDARVVEASRRHLPSMSAGLASPKLTLEICDGFRYMRAHPGRFDVVITDSSDPVGPAEGLFTESYFGLVRGALRPGGVACWQAGTPWVGLERVRGTLEHCRGHFGAAGYALASVPTYPCGAIGFVVGAVEAGTKLGEPARRFTAGELEGMKLRYYNGEVHGAAFVLPNFVREKLG